jgi:hypothetical protein
MIVCKLELWPGGIEEGAEHLGTIRIANTISTSLETKGKRGGYSFSIQKKLRKTWMKGRVENFPRLSYHPWNLIREILNQAAERNGGRI